MKRFVRGLRRHWTRATAIEGFVRLIVAGGIALVTGLWTVRLVEPASGPWLVGALLVFAGLGGLALGIWSQIEA